MRILESTAIYFSCGVRQDTNRAHTVFFREPPLLRQIMRIDPRRTLKSRAVNEWNLFLLITGVISIAMVVAMMRADLTSGPAVSEMIQLSVRCAVPLLYIAFAASSIQTLFPGPVGLWLLRNRKFIGLSFAAAMAWQGAFILWMVSAYGDYYADEVYVLRDAIEGLVGYTFLFAMTLTSFGFARKQMKLNQWKLLHMAGIYFLWAYAFSVYWWNLSYYENPEPIDYVFYWGGLLALSLRIAAWGKKRRQAATKNAPESSTPLALKGLGGAIIAVGLLVSATGLRWQEPLTAFLTAPKWSADLVLWLPYWPFEPFLSLLIIGFGAMLVTSSRG